MTSADRIVAEIRGMTVYLMETGLVRSQQWPTTRREGTAVSVSFKGDEHVAKAMKMDEYAAVYRHLATRRAYNAMLLDGAMVQVMYWFERRQLHRHRLAFFPAPDLDEFQNVPDDYVRDERYVHIVGRRVAAVPLRIDYDAGRRRHRAVAHPKCHMTLGQYRECRIPVSAPLTPHLFLDFVLRNFYDDDVHDYAGGLPSSRHRFQPSIHQEEQEVVHLAVPS